MKRVLLTAVILAWLLALLPSASAAFDSEIGSCARISDDVARLACFDQLAEKHEALSVVPVDEPIEQHTLAGSQVDSVSKEPLPGQGSPSPTKSPAKKARWLGMRPYRRNYILPVTYNSRLNDNQLPEGGGGFEPDEVEIKFQLSFELPVWEDILVDNLDLYFAYTQLSFFQAYNTEYSSPFRDTSYEPELGLNWHPDLSWSGWDIESLRLALNHQSNGQTESLSRSWNRLVGQVKVRHDDVGLGVRFWKRLTESSKDDDNPDIVDYLGHGELFAGYDRGSHRYGLMLRNPFEYPTVQLDWSYLLTDNVRLYVQYFNGYGESLIDYNRRANRIGVGFLLNEWP